MGHHFKIISKLGGATVEVSDGTLLLYMSLGFNRVTTLSVKRNSFKAQHWISVCFFFCRTAVQFTRGMRHSKKRRPDCREY